MDTDVFCIGCGYYRPNLIPRTGVCAHCTAQAEDKLVLHCVECGKEKPVRRHEIRPKCTNCRRKHYLATDPAYRLQHNLITARNRRRKRVLDSDTPNI